jgi:hypothetical protein
MIDELFDSFRRASETSVRMQQDMWKFWTRQFFPVMPNPADTTELGRGFQKRWVDQTVEMLNRHRESLDAAYKSGIQIIEQSFRVSEARSPEDYRRMTEDLWRKLLDTFKDQYETQARDFQRWAERSFESAQRPPS